MAILNFINDGNMLDAYKDFFREKEVIVFSECFAVGTIPMDIFQTGFKDDTRIEAINNAFQKNCSYIYRKKMSSFMNIDYSRYSGICLYFTKDMSSQINHIALAYNLDLLKRRGVLSSSTTIQVNIIDFNRTRPLQDTIIYSRYLTSVDLEDLSMTFFNLIKAQNEPYSVELVDKICERITSNYNWLRIAVRNYYYIRSDEFKEKCKRKPFENDYDYSKRMVSENKDLGLDRAYFLGL